MTKAKTIQQQQLVSKHIPKQKHLPLEINLDQIFSPHPKVVEAYKDTGDQFFPYDENPECINEKRIFLYANASKPRAEIRHRITSLYRRKEFGGKEFCWFNEHLITHDLFHNPLDHTRTLGKYQLPKIVTQMGYNPNTTPDPTHPVELGPTAQGAQIESVSTVYEFEFEKLKPQLEQWYKQGILDDSTVLHACVGTKKYTVNSLDEFLNLRIEDLVLLNRTKIDATGLFASKDMSAGILAMAREKALEKLTKSIGEEAKHSVSRGVRI
jgi:hypothetical protein